MTGRVVTDQIRRILVFALGPRGPRKTDPQLELAFWPEVPAVPESEPEVELSDRAHALLLELTLLIQMEAAGLVSTRLKAGRRHRIGLGGGPPLRLLAEWPSSRPAEDSPWRLGVPSSGREEVYAAGLGRVRALVEAIELTPARLRETVRRLYALASTLDPVDDLPGQIYGHSLRHVLRRTPTGRLGFQAERIRGRGLGSIQTPPDLAQEMIDLLIASAHRDGDGKLEVLDPACGSGQFLLAAACRAVGARLPEDDPAGCAQRLQGMGCISGVDLDPQAARLAAWNLCHWTALKTGPALQGHRGSRPDVGSFLDGVFGKPFPWFLGKQIQVGNALQVEPSSLSPGFLWERRYPHVFERERPGFDIVAGNPPWVSHGLRDRAAAPEEERRYYERLYPAGTQYKLTLYPLFMELALRLCRSGGCQGFLVPDSVLTGHHFSRIRRLLLSNADLLDLTLVESGTWPGVHVGHTVLYAVRKKGADLPPPVSVRNRVLKPRTEPKRAGGETCVWVPSTQYAAAGSAPLRIYRDEGEMGFLARMQAAPLRIRDVAWMYSGLIARYGQRSIQAEAPAERFELRDGRGTVVYEDSQARAAWRPALLSGGEVVPFGVRWKGGHVYMPPERESLARVYKSGFDLARYRGAKLLLRQTGDSLIAAVDHEGFYCLNNLHLVGTREGIVIPPLVLAGVLMSGPLQRAYRISTLESARPLAQVDLKSVEALPYPADRTGTPVGSVPPPSRSVPQARRILRAIDRALASESADELLALAEEGARVAGEPLSGGPLTGREVLSLLLIRLGEILEEEARTGRSAGRSSGRRRSGRAEREMTRTNGRRGRATGAAPSAARRLLDGVVGVFFLLGPG